MEQKNKHRLAKVAKEFGVGVSTLLDYFNKEGISGLNPNSKIDQEQYQKALNKFGDEKLIKEKIIEQKEQEAQMFKKTISIDDVDSSDVDGAQNEKSDEFLIKDQSKIDNDETEEKSEKNIEDVETEKQNIGPKVLGKINLDEFNKKKYPKNKNKKETEKQPKKAEIIITKENIVEQDEVVVESKELEIQEVEVPQTFEQLEKEQTKQIVEEEIKEEKILQTEIEPEVKDEIIEQNIIEDEIIEDEIIEDEVDDDLIIDDDDDTIIEDELVLTDEDKSEVKHIETEDIEKLKGPTVVGKIDLKSMNLKTRPDKKTKKEKEDERKKRQQEQRKTRKKPPVLTDKKDPQKEVKKDAVKEPDKDRSKRRKGPRVEKVEINKEGRIIGNNNTKRLKKKKVEPVVTDEVDVQKQVRETLQKLEQKQKSQAAKFRKNKRKEHHKRATEEIEKQEAENKILKLTEFITVKELADLMNIEPNKIIELCFDLGQPVTINFRLDSELINMISEEYMFEVEYVQSSFEEEVEQMLNAEDNQVETRPPIVTVMGHVDHGKTSLLDYIRETNVVASESGGITQHIGAYSVKQSDKIITFIDTPGHEAFTAMRARGTKVTDIAIIIIAADDSIMPQTEEAIDHARAAGVPMVFAINKIDKNGADPERIKQQLAEHNLLVEDWGGKYGCVEISAKKGLGIENLLERVWLEAEMLELKANSKRNAIATVLEAQLDKGRGYITNIIVRTGTLNVGDVIVAGAHYGKVKALYNEYDKKVKKVGPSTPIQILGLNGAPEPGDPLVVMDNDRDAREKADHRLQIIRELEMRARKKHSLEDISKRLAEGEKLDLNFIVKADVKGSADAITDQIQRLSNEEVNVNVIRSAVGQISDNDIMLAAASNTIIVGFNVRPSLSARKLAESKDIEIRLYSIIYDIINDVKAAVHGMLAPVFKEEILGIAEVLNVFKITKVGTIAGSLVRDGKLFQNNNVRVIRDGIVIYTGKLESLKRYKEDVKEVQKGYECGIGVENFNDIKVGDFIEAFKDVEVERKFE
ncbi:MAG: translation initiation factor IF-2 [Bacteroidales bacterium]|nr:translation initiation factor IF-2 [Bacteroidales bacterium]